MRRYGLLAIAIVLVAIYLFPLYGMYITALKTDAEIVRFPPTYWPESPNLRVAEVWTRLQMRLLHDQLGDHRARHHAHRRLVRHRLRLRARADPQPLDGRRCSSSC